MTDAPDDDFAQMTARKKRNVRIATRVGGALLATAFVVWAPGWMIGRASKSYEACSNADYEDQPNPSTNCTGAKAWLVFPKIVPWKRASALEKSKSIDADAAERMLKLATSYKPDPAARDEAARAATAAIDAPDRLASVLGAKGVGWAVGERKSTFVTTFAQASYIRQAIAHGDIDDVMAFAKNPPKLVTEDYVAREVYLKRGALVCLSGDAALGRTLLHDAMRVQAEHHDFPFSQARIALAACGENTEPGSRDLDATKLLTFQIGDRIKGRDLEDRLIGRDDARVLRDEHVSPFVAAAIAESERPLEETLKLIAALGQFPTENLVLWAWENGLPSEPTLVDPAIHEKAAERLEALARAAPESQAALQNDYSLPIYTNDRYLKIHQTPKATLGQVARGLWIEAGAAWSQQHQCDRAEAALRRAHALRETGDERIPMTSVLIACDRWDFASELAQDESHATKLATALLVAIRAQALAHAGKFSEARALAKTAYERSGPIQATNDPLTGFSDEAFVRAATSYLFLALASKTKDMTGAPQIDTPTIYERDKTTWDAFAMKAEAERANIRWRMFDFDGPLYSAARPAELFVVGSVAPDSGVEVWLDRAAFTWSSGKEGARNMHARAEAARWRGDSAAEAEWLNRAAKIERLLKGPREAILARIAGL